MTIKITSCSDQLMWYASEIGNTFEVIHDDFNEYLVRTGKGDTNVVLKKDCVIHDDPEMYASFMTKENFKKYNNL